jgi:hypothetical protein
LVGIVVDRLDDAFEAHFPHEALHLLVYASKITSFDD